MDNYRVLITGGTGSFGQSFTQKLLDEPDISMIRVYSRDEHKQRMMREWLKSDRVSFFIGDVRDKERLSRVMEGCDWVVHAAALKQAPLGEIEPQEFIKTNIFGSMNVIEAALHHYVRKCLLISTDKAVEPINLYGATKMCAEKMFLQADKMRDMRHTRFSVTRYGNVAGTNGSIIPRFLTIPTEDATPIFDPEATRFWISLPEANEFVLNSLRSMNGGELFIPKLRSVRVTDIAFAIRPDSKVAIHGPRLGDKKHETLHVNHATGERYTSDNNEFLSIEEIRQYVFGSERPKQNVGKG